MKKAIRIILPVILAVAIILCTAWYLLIYDRAFTKDVLLGMARTCETQGNHSLAAWFYNVAYAQSGNGDDVAIELAEQYKSIGNFTKAEYTLANAIKDGGGVELYVALCRTYVEQDKLLDAVTMLDNISNPDIKNQLETMRPATPTISPEPGFYSQFISATLSCDSGTIYFSTDSQYPSIDSAPYSAPIALADGENTIYTLAISNEGLVSPLSIYGYTIGGVIQQVDFTDPAIEASIRSVLNVNEDTPLTTSDLWTIKSYEIPSNAKDCSDLKHLVFLEQLTANNLKISELSFLSSLVNLKELTIQNTAISGETLSAISGLLALNKLTLSNCSLSDISPLSKLTGLTYLNLSNNSIRKIDALSSLLNLQELNLQHNALTAITALSGMSNLTKLDISYNALKTLEPACKITSLTWLDASVNKISVLGQFSNLANLTNLNLGSNQLSNVSALASCTALVDLNISSNSLTDISQLSALTNMMYLDFSYNQVKNLPAFPKSCQLVTIKGSHNQISTLEKLRGLSHLNIVHMDYNTNISSVKPLADCPLLIEVNVYATKVKDVKSLTDQSIIVNYKPV